MKSKYRKISQDFKLIDTDYNYVRKQNEPECIRNTLPIVWHKAKDFIVQDENENSWIDFTSGIFVSNAGHSNKKIGKAIKKQIDSELYFSFLYDTKIRNNLTNKILEISPNYFNKVVLASTGTEATDLAYKLIKYWAKNNNKKYIVTFRGSYHGRALSCDLFSGNEESSNWSRTKDEEIVFIDFPYDQNSEFDPDILPPANEIAAFFLETYQGWGAWMYPQDYIKKLYNFARQNEALVCFDEIQSGFYRMGTLYGYETYGKYIEPDLICVGKGITSSLPLSAVITKKELTENNINMALGGTHSGNPLCCAAAIANLEFLTDKKFQKKLSNNVEVFEECCYNLLNIDIVKNVNVKGMVAGLIFKNAEIADKIVFECVYNGVLPVRTYKNSIKLAPPLTIKKEAILESFSVIKAAIIKVQKECLDM